MFPSKGANGIESRNIYSLSRVEQNVKTTSSRCCFRGSVSSMGLFCSDAKCEMWMKEIHFYPSDRAYSICRLCAWHIICHSGCLRDFHSQRLLWFLLESMRFRYYFCLYRPDPNRDVFTPILFTQRIVMMIKEAAGKGLW